MECAVPPFFLSASSIVVLELISLRNYMSLIKAAGRDRDVDRAFGIIQRLRENNAACPTRSWTTPVLVENIICTCLNQIARVCRVSCQGSVDG